MNVKIWLGFVLSLSLVITEVHARPKIGLVLGGGGAAGVSHVGVLKVLEENNIPIDMIAGNSMGAIVGSLYASGMSVEELDKTARTLDWLALFNDQQSHQDKSYRQKQTSSEFFTSGELGIGGGSVKLPSGLIDGQKLIFELRRLLAPVQHIGNFDQLPIPFRAVATDIKTGETVVLKSGNLATAVRASMSIPGLFSPVTINGRSLVDGLVSNNLPVDIAQQMGADILIVSRIPPSKEKPINSVLDVAVRSMDILMNRVTDDQVAKIGKQDILIIPQTQDIGNLDFDRVDETIPLGEKGARQQTAALQKLAKRLQQDNSPTIAKPKTDSSIQIAKIVIKNGSKLDDQLLHDRLNIKVGETLDFDKLQDGLNEIYGLGYFSLVDYQLTKLQGNQHTLTVGAREAEEGNQRLRFGFSLADDFDGNAQYQAGVQYIKKGITDKGTELRTGLVIGEKLRAEVELHHPLHDEKQTFFEPKVWIQESDLNVISGGSNVAEVRARKAGVQLEVGRALGKTEEVRAGVFYEKLKPELKTGAVTLPEDDPTYAGIRLQYNVDTLDSINFPTQGGRFKAQYTRGFDELGSDQDYDNVKLEGEKVWALGKHRIISSGELSATLNDNVRLVENSSFSNVGRLSGAEIGSDLGNYSFNTSVGYMRQLASVPQFAEFYVGGAVGLGNVWQNKDDVDFKDLDSGASVFVGAETSLGPVFLGLRKSEGDDLEPYFNFGRSF